MGKQIKDLSIEELKLFIGIVISMSLNKKNKVEYYWSQEGQAKYAKIISRLRFCEILSMLHFEMNEQEMQEYANKQAVIENISKDTDEHKSFMDKKLSDLKNDSLIKIRWILNHFKLKLLQVF